MTFDGIPVGLLDGIGLVGAVALFGIGLATGRLFTKRQYDEATHDRDEWRAESRIKDQQIAELHEQFHLVPEVARNVLVIMRALKQGSQGDES